MALIHDLVPLLHELLSHDASNAACLTLAGVVYLQWAGSQERRRTRREIEGEEEARASVPRMIEDLRVFQIANQALGDEIERLTALTTRQAGEAAALTAKAKEQGEYVAKLEGWLGEERLRKR